MDSVTKNNTFTFLKKKYDGFMHHYKLEQNIYWSILPMYIFKTQDEINENNIFFFLYYG